MGCFGNLFEQDDYMERWCRRCANCQDGNCPIIYIHEVFGLRQFDTPAVKEILDEFIPAKGADNDNGQCTMFVERVA
jgi:hypothetical protein